MGAMYRMTFGIIENNFQTINAEHNSRIISPQQKGFIKMSKDVQNIYQKSPYF
jgi:hypothetical protein